MYFNFNYKFCKKNSHQIGESFLVELAGLEPTQAEPKSVVLPLHHSSSFIINSAAKIHFFSTYGIINKKIFFKCYDIKKSVFLHAFLKHGPLAQLNRAFDYGSKGCRFESCRGHKK